MKTLERKKSVNSVEEVAVVDGVAGVKDAEAGVGAEAEVEAVGSVDEDMIVLALIRLTIVTGRSITMVEQDVVALVVDAEGILIKLIATIAGTVAGVDLAAEATPMATNNLQTTAVATTTAMSTGTSTTITTEAEQEINNSGTIDKAITIATISRIPVSTKLSAKMGV